MSLDPLAQLQADFTARLNSLAYFADIEVVSLSAFRDGNRLNPEAIADIEARCQNALAGLNPKNGKAGAIVRVPLPALTGRNPDVPGPRLDLRLGVEIAVNPLVNFATNGTGKQLSEIALQVIQAGHHYQLPGVASLTAGKDAFEAGVDAENGLLLGVVTLESQLNLDPPASVVQPTCTVGATVALACATAGAAIYYTTDGSLPWSGNVTASLYSAPFAVPSAGTDLRAAAYKSGLAGSNVLLRSF